MSLVLLYTVCHHVRMVSYFNLSYPSSPVPLRALSSMHVIVLQQAESHWLMSIVHGLFFPFIKNHQKHAIEFEPKWQRLITHERTIIVIGASGGFKTLNCTSDFFLSLCLSKLLICM